MFDNAVILITGGTGSFGKACIEHLLKHHTPRKIIVFSRDEFKQHELALALPRTKHPCLRFFIGDVRDKERMHRAFKGVDYIIHAAALKQVPTAEYNPFEAVKTNVLGAANLIDAAIDQGVKKVIALSTDKAVSPVNLYGATKLCSDKLFVAGNIYSTTTRFSVVRYGNVVGSRGSVIPLFLKQRESGVLTITDPRMTRFWITIEEAVRFVLDSFARMSGGEIFVPKLPSMGILDLARAIGPECRVETIGIRPGEKIHEVLTMSEEARNTVDCGPCYAVFSPFYKPRPGAPCLDGEPVPEDFEYCSGDNPQMLDVDDLQRMIATL